MADWKLTRIEMATGHRDILRPPIRYSPGEEREQEGRGERKRERGGERERERTRRQGERERERGGERERERTRGEVERD